MKHRLRIKNYLRYGDDFVLFGATKFSMETYRDEVQSFLAQELHLTLHDRNDVIYPCAAGLKFLGCYIFPTNRRLQRQSWNRVLRRTDLRNVASYRGLVGAHCDLGTMKQFDWHVGELLNSFD